MPFEPLVIVQNHSPELFVLLLVPSEACMAADTIKTKPKRSKMFDTTLTGMSKEDVRQTRANARMVTSFMGI